MAIISSDYLDKQKQLHKDDRYGAASISYAPLIIEIMESTGIRSVCDYGAGKCRLGNALSCVYKKLEYLPFDPAFPEYGAARQAELVTCIDVLEHIEPEYLDNVISELAQLTTNIGFFSIHTGPATKVLPDGRNAHLLQYPADWWLEKLLPHFGIIQLTPVRKGFWILVQHKDVRHAELFARKKNDSTWNQKLSRDFKLWLKRLRGD